MVMTAVLVALPLAAREGVVREIEAAARTAIQRPGLVASVAVRTRCTAEDVAYVLMRMGVR